LSLDDKEVDELVDIANNEVESLLRDGIVVAGTELGG